MAKNLRLSQYIAAWCNENSPKSEGENLVIQYGIQLFVSSVVKLILILAAGACIHKLYETAVILAVFCTLRLQAGGRHAKTEFGCTACMVGVWCFSLAGGSYLFISTKLLFVCYLVGAGIILKYAPDSVNVALLTDKMKQRKRVFALLLLSVYFISAFFSRDMRGYLVWPAVIETLSLLPIFKDKGGEQT